MRRVTSLVSRCTWSRRAIANGASFAYGGTPYAYPTSTLDPDVPHVYDPDVPQDVEHPSEKTVEEEGLERIESRHISDVVRDLAHARETMSRGTAELTVEVSRDDPVVDVEECTPPPPRPPTGTTGQPYRFLASTLLPPRRTFSTKATLPWYERPRVFRTSGQDDGSGQLSPFTYVTPAEMKLTAEEEEVADAGERSLLHSVVGGADGGDDLAFQKSNARVEAETVEECIQAAEDARDGKDNVVAAP